MSWFVVSLKMTSSDATAKKPPAAAAKKAAAAPAVARKAAAAPAAEKTGGAFSLGAESLEEFFGLTKKPRLVSPAGSSRVESGPSDKTEKDDPKERQAYPPARRRSHVWCPTCCVRRVEPRCFVGLFGRCLAGLRDGRSIIIRMYVPGVFFRQTTAWQSLYM